MTDKITVLGVGNLLWADEGIGPRLAVALEERLQGHALAQRVEVIDGGTQGLYLLPIVTEAKRLLLFDAVSLGQVPGALVILHGDEVEARFSHLPVSLHQTSLQDLRASARLLGWQPEQLALIGIQAKDTESWGGPVTPEVLAAVEPALQAGLELLEDWDVLSLD